MDQLVEADVRSMTVCNLRKHLTGRGLDATGRKNILVQRLIAAIRSDPDSGNGDQSLPDQSTSPQRDREDRETTTDTSVAAAQTQPEKSHIPEDDLRSTIVSVMAETLPTLPAVARQDAADSLPSAVGTQSGLPQSSVASASSIVQSGKRLPTGNVPQRVVDRILTGEFINFSDLLPDLMRSSQPSSQPVFQFQVQDGVPKFITDSSTPKTRKVDDLSTWLEAFTIYMHTITQTAPHRVHELLCYQALIIEANRRLYAEGWLEYDQLFRQAAARDAQKPWDVIEPTLWQLATTGKARPTCSQCRTVHPATSSGNCPFRTRQTASSTSTTFNPEFQGKQICRSYNANRCSGSCFRAHVCILCRGRQPATNCQQSQQSQTAKSQATKPGKVSRQ